MESVLDEVAKTYKDKVDVQKRDVYKYMEDAVKYRVKVVPTIVFLDEKGELVKLHEGKMTKSEITAVLKTMGVK